MCAWHLAHAVRNRAFMLVNLTHSTWEVRTACESLPRECASSSYQAFAQPAMHGSEKNIRQRNAFLEDVVRQTALRIGGRHVYVNFEVLFVFCVPCIFSKCPRW
ncbi:hypothetical protein TRVL_08111 [Trypanosoma vivax]|nr:hypothetical protein TRVL_08111 [Trypanosoma vivax]